MTDSSTTGDLPFWGKALPYLLFGLLSLLYLIVIPTGESPDEPGHLRCIEQVSVQGQLPTRDPRPQGDIWWHPDAILSGYICYHTPLYYLLAGGTQRLVTAVTNQPPIYRFPPHNYDFGPRANLFEHNEHKPNPWQLTDPWHILSLRLLSILLSGVLIWGTMRIAQTFDQQQPVTALIAGLIIAGWPQFVYFSRSLNNDILATTLAILILVVLLRIGRPQRYWLVGLLSALALLTKLTTSFTLIVILLVWVIEAWHYRQWVWSYAKNLAVCLVFWVGAGLLLLLQPTLNQNLLFGIRYISGLSGRAGTVEYWQEVAKLTLSSGWVRFGWMNLAAPMHHAYLAWSLVGLLVCAALFFALRNLHAHWPHRPTIASYIQVTVLLIWLVGSLASYIRINMTHFQPQFRFIFVLLPVIAAVAAIGLEHTLDRTRWLRVKYTICLLLILFWLGYNGWIIKKLVIPAYY
jgi:4-amino-4-deoxy-L-arabinose transferase-like glycosyltransferase